MKCPFCGHLRDKVVDSRESKEGEVIRRRRECLDCGRRFTSYERIDEIPYMVIKKDGTRERFERQKLIAGLLKACEKRPVSVAAVVAVANRVEATVQERPEKEMSTEEIGEIIKTQVIKRDVVEGEAIDAARRAMHKARKRAMRSKKTSRTKGASQEEKSVGPDTPPREQIPGL